MMADGSHVQAGIDDFRTLIRQVGLANLKPWLNWVGFLGCTIPLHVETWEPRTGSKDPAAMAAKAITRVMARSWTRMLFRRFKEGH